MYSIKDGLTCNDIFCHIEMTNPVLNWSWNKTIYLTYQLQILYRKFLLISIVKLVNWYWLFSLFFFRCGLLFTFFFFCLSWKISWRVLIAEWLFEWFTCKFVLKYIVIYINKATEKWADYPIRMCERQWLSFH